VAAYRLVEDTIWMAGQRSSRGAVTVSLSDAEHVLQIRLSTTGLDAIAGEHIVARAQDRIVALNGSVTLATAGDQMFGCVCGRLSFGAGACQASAITGVTNAHVLCVILNVALDYDSRSRLRPAGR
jgi:hypothetical protein